jgi:hypothetical protein
MTIGRDEMFAPMLAACPTFEQPYHEFLRDWENEAEKPYYVALLDLVIHLIAKLAARQTGQFPQVFEVVERWLLEGDHYVREATTVGLLEGLQNTNHHQEGTTPADFVPFLGPEAKYWWVQVEQFWKTGELIRDRRSHLNRPATHRS